MSDLQNLIDMIREFYYERNGKSKSIGFLQFIIRELEMTKDSEWDDIKQ